MKEYPLYTNEAAGLCPSARYVAGVSRWLCECDLPEHCQGVQEAPALLFKSEALELIQALSSYVGVGINQGAYTSTVAGNVYPENLLKRAAQFTKNHKGA